MPRVEEVNLNFKTLGEMDQGKLDKLFAFLLQQAKRDCENRPFEKKVRKVMVQFNLVPVGDKDTGELDRVRVSITGKCKTPDFVTKEYEMRANSTGMSFNKEFPDELDQPSLFGDDEEDDSA